MSKNKMVKVYWTIIIVAVVAMIVFFSTKSMVTSVAHYDFSESNRVAYDIFEDSKSNISLHIAVYSVCMFAIVASTVGLFFERYGKKRDVPQCCDKKDGKNEGINS